MTFSTRRDFSGLQERVNRILRESVIPESAEEALTSNFAPPVDVYEDEHTITLKIEVPGIDENDINVSIENNTLTVRGERRFEKDEKEENFHRVERVYGSFARSFTLPNTVDPEQISALYERGVLKIRLAKKAEAKPKLIKVNVEKTVEAKSPSKVA
jgi:HSP20 family protein